jgi:hypothetical protein
MCQQENRDHEAGLLEEELSVVPVGDALSHHVPVVAVQLLRRPSAHSCTQGAKILGSIDELKMLP